jgi:hypothetical protein
VLSEPDPLTAAQIYATNLSGKDAFLAIKTFAIARLPDAAELAKLDAWKQNRAVVNRVDLSNPNLVWPDQP